MQTVQKKILSPRETEALQLLSLGFSFVEIAAQMSISLGSARNYAQSAREKLGAYSTAHAVRIAIEKDVIET